MEKMKGIKITQTKSTNDWHSCAWGPQFILTPFSALELCYLLSVVGITDLISYYQKWVLEINLIE